MSDDRGEEVALMVIRAGDVEVAVEATRVHEVVPLEQWNGEAALDLQEQTGAGVTQGPARILVVTRPGRPPLAAIVSAAVTLRHVARAQLLSLPPLLRAHVRWASHVAIAAGRPPLLLVDPGELGPG